jgi:hypothetical protein
MSLLALLLIGAPAGLRPHFATQYDCPPRLSVPCERFHGRVGRPGENCFFENAIVRDPHYGYLVGGQSLTVVTTQGPEPNEYTVEWWNLTNAVVPIHAFEALASGSCVPNTLP